MILGVSILPTDPEMPSLHYADLNAAWFQERVPGFGAALEDAGWQRLTWCEDADWCPTRWMDPNHPERAMASELLRRMLLQLPQGTRTVQVSEIPLSRNISENPGKVLRYSGTGPTGLPSWPSRDVQDRPSGLSQAPGSIPSPAALESQAVGGSSLRRHPPLRGLEPEGGRPARARCGPHGRGSLLGPSRSKDPCASHRKRRAGIFLGLPIFLPVA